MKWLVSAFEPFGGAQSNSSLIALNQLKQREWNGKAEFFAPIPVTFADAWSVLHKEIAARPGVEGILSLGQVETRGRLRLERVGLNWIDARIADNSGRKPSQAAIQPGPELLWSPIPWDRL